MFQLKLFYCNSLYLFLQAVFFGIRHIKPQCPFDDDIRRQCVLVLAGEKSTISELQPWLVFTMAVGFLIPLCATSVSYILTLREIKAIQVREQRKYYTLRKWLLVATTRLFRGHWHFSSPATKEFYGKTISANMLG